MEKKQESRDFVGMKHISFVLPFVLGAGLLVLFDMFGKVEFSSLNFSLIFAASLYFGCMVDRENMTGITTAVVLLFCLLMFLNFVSSWWLVLLLFLAVTFVSLVVEKNVNVLTAFYLVVVALFWAAAYGLMALLCWAVSSGINAWG